MSALPSILSIFPNEFNMFNNTGAQMPDSIYYMTLKLHFIKRFLHQNVMITPLENTTFLWTSTHNVTK